MRSSAACTIALARIERIGDRLCDAGDARAVSASAATRAVGITLIVLGTMLLWPTGILFRRDQGPKAAATNA